ncbi:hypothetical protein ACJJTC_018207, partial [Scirpophaga incertulas]
MKNRFNTYDIICMVTELQRLIGMRVNQVYDIDNRTYVIRLQRSEEKCVLLLESGNRFHTTQFEWPKNVAPSGFTMKLRKHLKNKRLEKLTQLGIDRIVDLQFGSGEAAYHVILELYDRGNIVLTDYEWTILNVLRPHVEGDKIRFAVKEKYPLDRAKTSYDAPPPDALKEILLKGKPGDNLKKILNPNLEFGSAIIDHVLLENGLAGNMKVSNDPNKGFLMERDLDKLIIALQQAQKLLDSAKTEISKGYIIQKKEQRPNPEGGEPTYLLANLEFHPLVFAQHKTQPLAEYETFDRAVDEFFSALEGQKIDMKTVQVEREAMKKLQNVRKDHEKRVTELQRAQASGRRAAELVTRNEGLVERARQAVQAALAAQMSWEDIQLLVKTAQENGDPIASYIKELKLKTNHITLLLGDPYEEGGDDGDLEPMLVDIDLSLTAFANARSSITKARKSYWFEKFFWFISSDDYLVSVLSIIPEDKASKTPPSRPLVIFQGGRDQQQNELIVKRYMKPGDLYVHAEITGASSVVIKNPTGAPVPPKTLAEAGQAAVAYSIAWEAKVVTRAWWVAAGQVSKSAPTGEYLPTGSFMIRGKKNYLLPEVMQFGFSFMFRLEDSCIERHRGERRSAIQDDAASEVTSAQEEEQEIIVSDDEDEPSESTDTKTADLKLDTIPEESKSEQRDTLTPIDAMPKDDDSSREEDIQTEKCDEGTEKGGEDSDSDVDGSTDSDDESAAFPNTHVKVDHGTGEVIMQSKTRTISEASDKTNEEKLPSFPSLPKKGGKKPQPSKEKKPEPKQENQLKRGQRGKLKKIREKYKNQDDDDKDMMMKMLQSAKSEKESKKAQKKAAAQKSNKGKASRAQKIPQPAPLILEADSEDEPEAEQVVEGDYITVHTAFQDTCDVYLCLLSCYMKGNYLKFTDPLAIDPKSSVNFLPLKELYLGVNVSKEIDRLVTD